MNNTHGFKTPLNFLFYVGKEQPPSKGPAVKAIKKGVKDKKGGKASSDKAKPGKGGKEKTKKDKLSNETQTDKSALKSKDKLTKSDIIIVNTPRPGSPSKGVETIIADSTEKDKVENKDKSPKATKKKQEKSKLFREKTDVSAVSSVRRPGTVLSLSGIDSTIKDSTLKTEQVRTRSLLDQIIGRSKGSYIISD